MDDEDEVIWVNLKIISKLQPFERLGTRRAHFEINPSHTLQETLFRWWSGSNRESDFNRIKDLYKAAKNIQDKHHEGKTCQRHQVFCPGFMDPLDLASLLL